MEDYEGSSEMERAWREGLTPDPLLTVSEWSDRHRMLSSKASAEPGRWRTSRTPYLKAIMDCLSPASKVERVAFMKGAQLGAPLALDTPIPTPTGWTTLGEVHAGDHVMGSDGWPCRVLGVSPILQDRDCFEIEFEDGQTVVSDGEHRWAVNEYSHAGLKQRTVTTLDMHGRERFSSGKRWRFSVDNTQAMELPARDLLIHPYLLGLWLGDGSASMNHISVHEDDAEIVEHLADCGVHALFRLPAWRKGKCANLVIDPTFRTVDADGQAQARCGSSRFTVQLRHLDVLGNKHIPPAYLRASRQQRLELVQGLMDSDGSITPEGKTCEFVNGDRRLIDGMLELLCSLGYRPHCRHVPSRCKAFGEQQRVCHGYWRVSWTAYAEQPMFRLRRKRERMRSIEQGRLWKSRRRAIIAVRPVPSVPVRCIAVDSPNHLFLCGKGWIPTHNTEMGSNWIGYVIHHAPGPMMAVWPTVDMAKRNSKQRIDPLIEESGVLAELIAPARSRDSGNTILAKEFRGGVLVMTGANSAVGLRSMPVRYLFLDEVDGYPLDVEGEGDAISLAEARTRTFARRKIFIVSTPTISGASAIEREYEASDQRRYFVPCPHCAHRQWLRFEQLRWEKGQPDTAAYICESCDESIAEHHKTWMLEHGEWRAMISDGTGKTAGFHLSSLYSPVGWRSWRDIAAAWESAVNKESGSAAAIKTFKNTELGETWVEEGEAPDWQRLVERREDYRIGAVPNGGMLLVGGADVQKDRIEASIWAFGRGKESWLVEHRVLMGDTARDAVWKRLAELLAENWTHASGAAMPLARFALDTGFATQEAYTFVRACRDPRVMPVKGVPRGAALIGTPTAIDVSQGGKKLRRGIKVFTVAVGIAKLEFYNNLRKGADVAEDGVTTSFPAGFVHLPRIDAEFIQQLCAEQLITRRDRNGFPIREWQKMRERNEALDCFDAQTEVLTQKGWKRFRDVSRGDTLATVNLATDGIEYQSPQHLIARHYQGPMLTVSGTRLNFSVTPGHRMVTYKKVFDRENRTWRFDVPPQITLAQDLTIHHTLKIRAVWHGESIDVVTIAASVKRSCRTIIEPQRRVCAKTFAAFLGWYIAEGSSRIVAHGSSIQRAVGIAQVKPQGVSVIESLLDRLPWQWHWSGHAALITSKQLYDYIQRECPGLHHEKRVPSWIKDASVEIIESFVAAAVAGDGWIQNGYRSYATTSKALADDMAELFFKLGGSPSVTVRCNQGWSIRGCSGSDRLPQYHVRENRGRKSASLDGKNHQFLVKTRQYNGMVYCATVPNGTLVVRRAGKMMIAGNCYVYARAAASAAGLDRFEERHWRELERQLGMERRGSVTGEEPPPIQAFDPDEGTQRGGLSVSATPSRRRVIKSRWLS